MTVDVTVSEVRDAEMGSAAGVLARGLRDNPVYRAAFGKDRLKRERTLERLYGRVLPTMQRTPICARRAGGIVGVLGLTPPGTCRPTPRQAVRLVPAVLRRQAVRLVPTVLRTGPTGAVQIFRLLLEWERHHPGEPHWHLGPGAVEPELQGRGIGGRMLEWFVEHVGGGDAAYLETDKLENVRLFERFGFEVVEKSVVLGVTNWFMWRKARRGA
jgi:GNAT superfamily N-acetyltransferase